MSFYGTVADLNSHSYPKGWTWKVLNYMINSSNYAIVDCMVRTGRGLHPFIGCYTPTHQSYFQTSLVLHWISLHLRTGKCGCCSSEQDFSTLCMFKLTCQSELTLCWYPLATIPRVFVSMLSLWCVCRERTTMSCLGALPLCTWFPEPSSTAIRKYFA